MKARNIVLFLFLVVTLTSVQASYRVYQLKIVQYDANGKIDRIYVVMSTLDPFQYENYYAGYRWMHVTLNDTWYCPGDTGHFRKYCPRPIVASRGPSSFDHPKRVDLPYQRQPVIP